MVVKDEQQEPQQITLHYIKSNAFRVIHADGAHGGITPNLKVQMALFSERYPIPQRVVQKLEPGPETDSYKLGEVIESSGRGGIVREVEAEIIMDPGNAEIVAKWLLEKAEEARAQQKTRRRSAAEGA